MGTCGYSWASHGHSYGISSSPCPKLNVLSFQAHSSCSLQISGWPTLHELTGQKHPCSIPPSCISHHVLGTLALPGSSTGHYDLHRSLPSADPHHFSLMTHCSLPTACLPPCSLPTNTFHAPWPEDYRNVISRPGVAAPRQDVSFSQKLNTHLPNAQGTPPLGPQPTEIKTRVHA